MDLVDENGEEIIPEIAVFTLPGADDMKGATSLFEGILDVTKTTEPESSTERLTITYNPKKISYEELLELFWKHHEPTNPQHPAHIYCQTKEHTAKAELSKTAMELSGGLSGKITTQIHSV